VSEAVRIEMRGGNTLNSKTKYNRCRIPRLVIDQEVWQMKMKEKEILEEEKKEMEEEIQPIDMRYFQDVLGPEKKIFKRKDKPTERKNAKKMKLVKLDGWRETPVSEKRTDIRQWLLESSLVEQNGQEWPERSFQVASQKMKEMELSFAKILNVQTVPELDGEHARRMEETPTKLPVCDETSSGPYVRNTGKMTKKEITLKTKYVEN
jgi:hypothetical protein